MKQLRSAIWLAYCTVGFGFLSAGPADRYEIVLAWLAGVVAVRTWRTKPGAIFAGLYLAAVIYSFVIPVWGARY